MRHPLWHLVDVMRDEHERRRVGIGGERRERTHQLLAATDVEPGRGLVEEHHRRVVHQRAGEENALLLARRQRAERAVSEMTDTHPAQALHGGAASSLS